MELLAPAGNMESLIAAVQGGADAVYLGLTSFSARALAGNFNREEFIEAIEYCHTRNVKVYVTLNTILDEDEFKNVIKDLDFIYENGVDAVLVQDFGLLHYIKTCYPELEVHASTQMHVHNIAGINQMISEGVKRVVLARETPIELIKEATKLGVEIEVFGYGAICVSYSGQCLFSSVMKHRSANKGLCAQFCRMKYFKEDSSRFSDGDYILSPKDLNVLENLKELYEAGVSCIKIEGRMKRKEYVYLVTKTFREAIDALENNETYYVSKKRNEELALLFNRDFSKGHIFNQDTTSRMNHYRGNHLGVEVGEVLEATKDRVKVKLNKDIHQNDGLRILDDKFDIGLTAVKIEKNKNLVKEAFKGDIVWLTYHEINTPRKGSKVLKTSDVLLLDRIDEEIKENNRRSKINIKYTGYINNPFTILIEDEDGNAVYKESDYILSKADKKPISEDDVFRSFSKIKDTPFEIKNIEGDIQNIFIPISLLNELRREAVDELITLKTKRNRSPKQEYKYDLSIKNETPFNRIIINSNYELKDDERYEVVSETNIVDQHLTTGSNNHKVLNEIGDLSLDNKECLAGMSLNICNSYAIAYFLDMQGIDGVIFSSELNDDQIYKALLAFEKRYGFTPITYKLVYGKRNLMIIKDGFSDERVNKIKDFHGNIYDLEYNSDNVFLLEPKYYHEKNEYCYGSYLILKDETDKLDIILEENYEKIYGRI